MRTEAHIRQKLKQAQYSHFKALLSANYKKRPCNCAYNQEHASLNSDKPPVRLCMFGSDHTEEWQGVICDEDFGGKKLARDCTFFKPHKTKLELRTEFNTLMESSDLGTIAEQYPDVAALMWVLNERGASFTSWQKLLLWWQPAHAEMPELELSEEGDDDGVF